MGEIPIPHIIGSQIFQTGAEIVVSGRQTNVRARLDGLQQLLHIADKDQILILRLLSLRGLRTAGFSMHLRAAAAHHDARHQDYDQRQNRR